MKKLLLLLIIGLVSSCVPPQLSLSKYQNKNIKNFRKNKIVGVHVPKRKRGDVNHPAVKKSTKKLF